MIQESLSALIAFITSIIQSADTTTLIIAVAIAAVAGYTLKALKSVVQTTMGALGVFVVVQFIRGILVDGRPFDQQAARTIDNLAALTMIEFLVYFLLFWAVASIVYTTRATLRS